ncbi:MAG: MmcQ/YjbR family DNA-binding protein [Phenylobacterium sp.]|uniref:MmcQ/YjbR family DNA-binding protein n=1 Tax=Phenylobacterium sp. TaxID=1871053 RepID=UPI002734810F|nr:MmcQ/YjbR family DNA-binding protein [Phenylobacterium sp.]MDP3749538.1 MmcQ/YjbR family DNA-binding protein [Phenylobacterium sp.]
MSEDEFRTLCLSFPGCEEGFNMGSVVFKANGKVLARLLGGGEAMLTGIGPDEIDLMVEAEPAVFHASQHFRDAMCVAVRLGATNPGALKPLLDRRFREIARKSVLKAWDA